MKNQPTKKAVKQWQSDGRSHRIARLKTTQRRALPQLVELYLRISREDLIRAGIEMHGRAPNPAAARKLVVRTALHEAGHAVMARVATGTVPLLVTIERGSDQLEPGWGFTRVEPSLVQRLTTEQIEQLRNGAPAELFAQAIHLGAALDAMVFLAGPSADVLAQELAELPDLAGEDAPVPDCERARAVLAKVECDEEACAHWFTEVFEVTLAVLREPDVWAAVHSVAEALLNSPTLDEVRFAQFGTRKTKPMV